MLRLITAMRVVEAPRHAPFKSIEQLVQALHRARYLVSVLVLGRR